MELYALVFWIIMFFCYLAYLYLRFLKKRIDRNHFAFHYATAFAVFLAGVLQLTQIWIN